MSTMTQIEDLIKSSSNDLEALQGILDGVKDSMEDLRKEYESGKKDVNEYNAAMLKLQRVYDQVIDAQKNLQKEQKKADDALEKQHKKFKDVETSARKYGATLNTALSTISSMIKETNPVLSTALGSVQKLIPNLVDCLGQFQKLTKSAKAAGVEITTFGKLMKVAMSPSGILLVITAVVELISYLKNMNKELSYSKIRVEAVTTSGRDLSDAMGALNIAGTAFARLVKTGGDFDTWLKNWKSTLDATGFSINTLEDAEEVFVKNTSAYVKALNLRAEAQAREKAFIEWRAKYWSNYYEKRENLYSVEKKTGFTSEEVEDMSWAEKLGRNLFGGGVRRTEIAKKAADAARGDVASVNKIMSERTKEVESLWNEYYKALSGLKVGTDGGKGGNDNDKTPKVTIDWNSFYRMLDEALAEIESATDAEVLKLLGFASETLSFEDYDTVLEQVLGITEERKKATEQAFKDIVQGIATDGLDEEMNSIANGLMDAQNAQIEAERSIYNARLENYSNFLSSYADLTNSISGMISDNLDAELEAGKISEAEYKRRTKTLKAFQISSIVANTASGIVDVWKAYATERIGNAEAAVATGPAAPATLAALNAKSLTSAILQTATLSAAGVAGIASVRSGNLSGTSVTPSAGISSTPTITYTSNANSNQDILETIDAHIVQSAQQQVVLVVDDLNKVQSNATKVSVQSSF